MHIDFSSSATMHAVGHLRSVAPQQSVKLVRMAPNVSSCEPWNMG